ncbi:Retinol dehydrogenase 12 [Seminavis robusta]|uniref:Retinol dehydrogenase 12 n=1 Tax=Seminavis robusta TaxID=568900 RepID=A0A9N8DM99_9STRA|nr:Retinol dehydrogenase 12 [Seminavis robusta]|eukprot:Sro211_g087910.1 Retinol dehydrogenase 12 (378) ;mRNA; f:37641-38774
MLSSTMALPARAAMNYYSKSRSFSLLSLISVLYSAMAYLLIACIKLVPILNRGLPQLQEIPKIVLATPKVAIVTGSNTGIGFETSKALVDRGYQVILACRSQEKAQQAMERMERELGPSAAGKAVYEGSLDLSSFQSVHDFSQLIRSKYEKIDLLVNNAGRNTSGPSEKGLDLCFQTNFLGHFLLTQNLMDSLLRADQPRVVNLSSVMHHFCKADRHDETYWQQIAFFGNPHSQEYSYSASKLAALHFTIELNRRYGAQGLRSIAVNPGVVNSDIWRHASPKMQAIYKRIFLDNQQGSYTSVAASVLDNLPPDVIYLQPYHQVQKSNTPFPVFEIMGPFVGYQATQPRLPKDGTNGELSARILWNVSEDLVSTHKVD